MAIYNEFPYRKAKKIWKEFPYLWGILQDWNPGYEIQVRRLDDADLRIDVTRDFIRFTRVFLHMTRIEKPFRVFDGEKLQDWWETLEEAPAVDYSRPLADLLFESKTVQLRMQRGKELVIDAIVILSAIRVSGKNTPEKHDANIITIYKPPRERSIYEFIISKWMSLHAHVGVKC